MNTIDLMKNTNISFYGNVKYSTSKWDITLFDWITNYSLKNKDNVLKIREINKVDEKQAKSLKSELLPCVTISAIFKSYRRMDLVEHINPIICIDIDKNDNPEVEDWEKIKIDAFKVPGVFFSSLSCRGEGIFVLVYYDINKDFIKVWNSLKNDFKEILNLSIDKSCRDITRLRFISYDEQMRLKSSIDMYDKEIEEEINTIEKYNNDSEKIGFDDDFLYKAIYYLIKEDKFKTDKYADWLLNCFRLSTFGNYGQILFLLLSVNSSGFNYTSALNQFRECEKRTRMTKSSLLYYIKLLKDNHGANWKTIINEYVIKN